MEPAETGKSILNNDHHCRSLREMHTACLTRGAHNIRTFTSPSFVLETHRPSRETDWRGFTVKTNLSLSVHTRAKDHTTRAVAIYPREVKGRLASTRNCFEMWQAFLCRSCARRLPREVHKEFKKVLFYVCTFWLNLVISVCAGIMEGGETVVYCKLQYVFCAKCVCCVCVLCEVECGEDQKHWDIGPH